MAANPKHRYTLEEYFDLDFSTSERLEFFDGEIVSMSGGSDAHDYVESNTHLALRLALGEKDCRVFTDNMRIKVPSLPPYRYADVSATCEKPRFEKIGGVDALTNPTLIIEVLSDSTEAYDRGDKFTHYKSIPSLKEYLLIAQHRPHVTQYVKQTDGSWSYSEVNDISATIQLASVDCVLALNEIYRGVTFPAAPLPNLRPPSE
jgi:Uma2 family endonuclease